MYKDIYYLDSLLDHCSSKQILASSLLLVSLIASIEYVMEYEIAISIFLLVPIALSTWYGSRHQGMFISLLSVIICFALDNLFSKHAYSNPFLPYWASVWNEINQLVMFLVITQLLAIIKDQLRIKKQLSRTDRLTGLMNGRGFSEASQQLLTLAARHGRPTILAYIDLDNFRQMNDAFGHSEGDRALQAVGQIFLKSLRKTDLIGRLSGDEFAILLPETDATGARTKLGKLKNELAQKAKFHNWPIGFSMGVVSFELPPSSLDEAFVAAGNLMDKIKKNGKNNMLFEHFPKEENMVFDDPRPAFQAQSSLH